jgi:hypothetical protein
VLHATSGLLCLPAVFGMFGLGSPAVAVTLAGHGALCEVGWELQDVVTRACQVIFGGPSGKAKNPLPLLIITSRSITPWASRWRSQVCCEPRPGCSWPPEIVCHPPSSSAPICAGARLAVNLTFASEPYFHEMVFLLQFAAAVALTTQNYGCEHALDPNRMLQRYGGEPRSHSARRSNPALQTPSTPIRRGGCSR